MINIHYTDLAEKIKEVFVAQDTFILNKHFPEFRLNGKYFCDYLSMLIIEPQGKNPPIFYNTFSPFDIISQKAPDQAVIFQGGKMLLNVDFTDYISQRTGIMDAVVLKALGIKHIQEKQVLFIGTGKVASCSLIALKSIYPDMESVQYLNESGNVEKFAQTAEKLEITITKGDLEEIGKYDYIFCHARSIQPALPAIYKKAIKKVINKGPSQ